MGRGTLIGKAERDERAGDSFGFPMGAWPWTPALRLSFWDVFPSGCISLKEKRLSHALVSAPVINTAQCFLLLAALAAGWSLAESVTKGFSLSQVQSKEKLSFIKKIQFSYRFTASLYQFLFKLFRPGQDINAPEVSLILSVQSNSSLPTFSVAQKRFCSLESRGVKRL